MYYINVLKKYCDFKGRASRSEYWWFTLVNVVIACVLSLIPLMILGSDPDNLIKSQFLCSLYSLAVFLPGLGVSIRRLHDTDRSGWWILLGLIPFIGGVWLLVYMALPPTEEANDYGPNPLNVEE